MTERRGFGFPGELDVGKGEVHVRFAKCDLVVDRISGGTAALQPRSQITHRQSQIYLFSLAASPPVMPCTCGPICNARIRWISAGVATFGSTLAWAQVKPRSVHSDVVCLMPRSCISFIMSVTASSCMMTALFGTKVPTPIA